MAYVDILREGRDGRSKVRVLWEGMVGFLMECGRGETGLQWLS